MAMKETTISSGNLCDIFERALNGNVRSATILLKNGIAGPMWNAPQQHL